MPTSPNLLIEHIVQAQSQKHVTVNEGFDQLDNITSDHSTGSGIDFPSDADFTPDADLMRASYSLDVGGTVTGTKDFIVPDNSKNYLILNTTTAANITVTTSGGTGVLIENGQRALVFCDGTNVVFLAFGGGSVPYDVQGYVEGEPSLSTVIWKFVATRNINFLDDFAGSEAHVETVPDATTEFDVQVDSSSVGHFSFAMSAATATFVTDGAALSLLVGETLEIHSPADINVAADLAFTFHGSLA